MIGKLRHNLDLANKPAKVHFLWRKRIAKTLIPANL